MKTTTKFMLTMLALGASAFVASAQDNSQPWNDGPGANGQQGPRNGHRPPVPAIIAAIDANHDGVIDADEIANASAALKALDKNGDGKLTPDEFDGRPRPQHRGNQANGNANRPADENSDGAPDNMPPGPPPGDQ